MREILVLILRSFYSIRVMAYINELIQRQNNVLTYKVMLCMSYV